MTVGPQIRRLRKAKGWTAAQLAVYADMSPSAVSQIETGRRSPTATSMEKLAEALEVEVQDLFPKVQAPLLDEREEERREEANAVALEAARRQLTQDRQAAARAWESERPQAYFMRHDNEAITRLMQYSPDELADSLMELARAYVELEERRQLSLEDFPAEQVAAFLAENERDNARIRRELETMSAAEFREALLAVSPRLRRYFREESTSRETSGKQQRTRERPKAG